MIALASLSESARKLALDRFRLLSLTWKEKRPLKAVAREIGYRTAQRWLMRYRKYGLAGLARNDRADRGHRRTITPALKEILEALALQTPPMPIAALHRQLCRIAIERGQSAPITKRSTELSATCLPIW
jgi:putative transposase